MQQSDKHNNTSHQEMWGCSRTKTRRRPDCHLLATHTNTTLVDLHVHPEFSWSQRLLVSPHKQTNIYRKSACVLFCVFVHVTFSFPLICPLANQWCWLICPISALWRPHYYLFPLFIFSVHHSIPSLSYMPLSPASVSVLAAFPHCLPDYNGRNCASGCLDVVNIFRLCSIKHNQKISPFSALLFRFLQNRPAECHYDNHPSNLIGWFKWKSYCFLYVDINLWRRTGEDTKKLGLGLGLGSCTGINAVTHDYTTTLVINRWWGHNIEKMHLPWSE